MSISLIALGGCNFNPSIQAGVEQGSSLATGKVVSLVIWPKPVGSSTGQGSEEGYDVAESAPNSTVQVFQDVIIVAEPNGERIIVPHGWYTNLRIR